MIKFNKNILSEDLSPYLRQHKNNPVNWQIWSKDTLEFATKNKKPILLSIGYASCHWCHVMAHESFEDYETANIMNKLFVNIKVDREERPDLDFIFQSSFQLFNQTGGGWPLTMFLDENGVPFMGGTYFPKNSKNGLPSFKDVLKKVSESYQNQRDNIIKQKYLSERPSTFEISQSIPGRGGRWLGWKIVSSFMSSSTYTLEELLKEDDYKNIFYNSNYNPI